MSSKLHYHAYIWALFTWQKHQYSNAKQDDLWLALGTKAKIDKILPADMSVKEIMETWTLQLGYPVIHVNQMVFIIWYLL